MANDFATTAMWQSAVTDLDAVEHRNLVVRASVALAGTWPFLAAAKSPEEFEHRLALMSEQIAERTPEHIREEVVAGLREKFAALQQEQQHTASMLRTAALTIAKTDGESSLPTAYVHVHKHGSGDEEYHQIDFVGGPTFLQTIARSGDRDEALTKAREYALPNGLPLYENGRYVEGKRLSADEEFLDAKTGKWVKVAHQSWTPGGTGLHPAAGIADEAARARRDANWGTHLGAKDYDIGDIIPTPFLRIYQDHKDRHKVEYVADPMTTHTLHQGYDKDEALRAGRAYSEKHGVPLYTPDGKHVHGSRKTAAEENPHPTTPTASDPTTVKQAPARTNYQPDPDAAVRYHYPLPEPTLAFGGEPTAPGSGSMNVAQQAAGSSIGEDGFPIDVGTGEYDGAAAKWQQVLTPGQWTVPPDGGWPVRPNAGHAGNEQVFASKGGGRKRAAPVADHEITVRNAQDAYGHLGHDIAEPLLGYRGLSGVSREGLRALIGEAYAQGMPRTSSSHRTAASREVLEDIQRRDPDGGSRQPTQADYDAHHEWAVRTHGQHAWEAYRHQNWADRTAVRHTATEGAAPTPGPNPNYFSQGTQGLQGPAQFPVNPSGDIEPKPAPLIDQGVYGGPPPEMSTGSVEGRVDGGPYARQASLVLYPGRDSYEAVMFDGPERFLVGRWGNEHTAKAELDRYAEQYSRMHRVAVAKHAEYKYVKKQGDKWVVTQKGTGKVLSHHDSQEDAEASFRAMMESKHGSRRPLAESAGERRPSSRRTAARATTRRFIEEQGPEAYKKDYNRGWTRSHTVGEMPDRGISSAYEDGYMDHATDMEKWHATVCTDPDLHETCPTATGFAKGAATNGQIVGKCDHCGRPVRYHTERGGHLRHLDSDSPYCGDGKVATAMRKVEGGIEYRLPIPKESAVLENPTMDNPTGRGADPYRAKTTWTGFETQRPRQALDGEGGMNANTPSTAPEPIRTGPSINTPVPGAGDDRRERDDDEDQDDDE